MKVFLSHSTKDADFVKQLAAAITSAASEPWRYEVDVEKHEKLCRRNRKGPQVVRCRIAYLVARRCCLQMDRKGMDLCSAPRGDGAAGPPRHHQVTRASPARAAANQKLRQRPERSAGRHRDTLDWLNRRESAQRLCGLEAPVYLPDYRPQDFVGRTAQLAHLRNTLPAEPSVLLLHGEPGAGKSTLALQFAWEAQKDFDAAIFQICGRRSLDVITAELVERLPIDVKTLAPDKQRDEAKKWLRQRQSLRILDDIWPKAQATDALDFDARAVELVVGGFIVP